MKTSATRPIAPRKLKWILLPAVLALASVVSACGATASSSGTGHRHLFQIHVSNVPVAATEVLEAAQKQGFFKRNGLSVSVTESSEIATFIPALGVQYNMVMTTPTDFLNGVLHGYDLVAIGQAWEDAASLIAPKSVTIADLSGKNIGVPSLAGLQYGMVSYALKKLGVTNYNLTVIPFADQPAALKAGTISAADVPQPYAALMLEDSNNRVLFNPTQEATGVSDPLTGWYSTTKAFADAHPKVITSWEAAISEAMTWIPKHSQAYRRILEQTLEIQPSLAERVVLPPYDLHVTAGQFKLFEKPLVDTGQILNTIYEVNLAEHLLKS